MRIEIQTITGCQFTVPQSRVPSRSPPRSVRFYDLSCKSSLSTPCSGSRDTFTLARHFTDSVALLPTCVTFYWRYCAPPPHAGHFMTGSTRTTPCSQCWVLCPPLPGGDLQGRPCLPLSGSVTDWCPFLCPLTWSVLTLMSSLLSH